MPIALFCAPLLARVEPRRATLVCALRGPTSPKPVYHDADRAPHNAFFMHRFLQSLQSEMRRDKVAPSNVCAGLDGYDAVMCCVRALAIRYGTREGANDLRAASIRVLRALLPPWLPRVFVTVFSRPAPRLAARMCATVTVASTQWLMGDSHISADDPAVVEITRCRYLEEAACAGICLHSCKTATEQFFVETMELTLHVDPNFEDFSCKFRFGVEPPPPAEDPVFAEPCFAQCPINTRKSPSLK